MPWDQAFKELEAEIESLSAQLNSTEDSESAWEVESDKWQARAESAERALDNLESAIETAVAMLRSGADIPTVTAAVTAMSKVRAALQPAPEAGKLGSDGVIEAESLEDTNDE